MGVQLLLGHLEFQILDGVRGGRGGQRGDGRLERLYGSRPAFILELPDNGIHLVLILVALLLHLQAKLLPTR